jgi:hypothetical protein
MSSLNELPFKLDFQGVALSAAGGAFASVLYQTMQASMRPRTPAQGPSAAPARGTGQKKNKRQ